MTTLKRPVKNWYTCQSDVGAAYLITLSEISKPRLRNSISASALISAQLLSSEETSDGLRHHYACVDFFEWGPRYYRYNTARIAGV